MTKSENVEKGIILHTKEIINEKAVGCDNKDIIYYRTEFECLPGPEGQRRNRREL